MKDMIDTQWRPPVPVFRRSKSTKSLVTISPSGGAKQPLPKNISSGENRVIRNSATPKYTTNGKRPFASYYYTSSFPSLYSLFCGDRMNGINAVNLRPATTANGKIHQSDQPQPELPDQESEIKQNQVRFPWRRVTSADPQQQQGVKKDLAKPKMNDSANTKVKDNAEMTEISRTKAQVEDTDDVVDVSKNTQEEDEFTNIKIASIPNTRPPSSGTRNRSKSWASRPHDVTMTPKTKIRHHSSNSYATMPRTPQFTPFKNPTPIPVWNPSERNFAGRLPQGGQRNVSVDPPTADRPFLKSKSYAEFNRSSNNYKAAIANSYSPHLESKGRSRRKLIKTAQGVRSWQSGKQKEIKSPDTTEAENSGNTALRDSHKLTELSEVSKRLSLVGNQRQLGNHEDKIKSTSPGLQKRFEAKRELTNKLSYSTYTTPHRRLADSTIDAAVIYKERFRPVPKKTFLTPEQLVMRDSVEKVQRWIRTLPRHFDTIHHVLPPVRQDY